MDKRKLSLQENLGESSCKLDIGISIFDKMEEDIETNIYYVATYHTPTGETYPEIGLKDNKDIVCGADFRDYPKVCVNLQTDVR